MTDYGQFCTVARGAEIFGERWTPLVVRELFCGSRRFSDLHRGLPRIPKAVLVQRLRSLAAAGIVERRALPSGRGWEYHITPAGEELGEIVLLLGDWGQRWANVELGPHHLDPDLLIWDLHRRLHVDRLPERRVVVQIDVTGARQKSYWLVVERPTASVCWTDPGFDVDLLVTADTVALHRVWTGRVDLARALREGLIELAGPTELRRAFPDWLALSLFVERGRTATGAAVR